MKWNWELPDWPKFFFDYDTIFQQEKKFVLGVGSSIAYLKNIDTQEYKQFVVEILSTEGLKQLTKI